MRLSLLLLALFLATCASAAPLVPATDADPRAVKVCEEWGCRYHEWRVGGAADIRFVVTGYEDGLDNIFYRKAKDGAYAVLFNIVAVIRDTRGRYHWDLGATDLPAAMGPRGIEVWATFDHNALAQGYGNICFPLWQKRYPIVLFRGDRMPGESAGRRASYKFRKVALTDLAAQARRTGPGARLGNCDQRCCYPLIGAKR